MGLHTADPRIGSEFAGYTVERLVGRGGMGAVYLASDERLGRKVALKVLSADLADQTRFRDRFLRESRLAASIDHPNIVPIFEAGDADGVLFIAMRFVEGTDLAKLIESEGVLEPERALALVAQVADALDAAHERGLVHRDVKPGNVLVDARRHCYLADFGLTRQTSSQSGVTGTGQLVGTLDYVPPEQIRGEATDARSDQYSLACLLYETLTGSPPFAQASDVAVLWSHVNDPPPSAAAARPGLPRALDAVLARALAKDPAARFATCAEFVDSARRALGGVSIAIPMPRVSRKPLAAACVVVGLAALAALALVFLRPSGPAITALKPNTLGVIDPQTNELVAEIPVDQDPDHVTFGEGSVWVLNSGARTISRIDPSTQEVELTITANPADTAIVAGAGALWVVEGVTRVRRYNPTALGNPTAIDIPDAQSACVTPAIAANALWVPCASRLVRIDASSNRVTSFGFPHQPSAAVFAFDRLWVTSSLDNLLSEIDPSTGEILNPLTIAGPPLDVAVGFGALWVPGLNEDVVTRIVPRLGLSAVLTTINDVGGGPTDIAAGAGGVWVTNEHDRTVSRIDSATRRVVATIEIGSVPSDVAVGEGLVWVTATRG